MKSDVAILMRTDAHRLVGRLLARQVPVSSCGDCVQFMRPDVKCEEFLCPTLVIDSIDDLPVFNAEDMPFGFLVEHFPGFEINNAATADNHEPPRDDLMATGFEYQSGFLREDDFIRELVFPVKRQSNDALGVFCAEPARGLDDIQS